jgi:hypothetical protein
MANAGEQLVAVELRELNDAELMLRYYVRQAQGREFPRCKIVQEIVAADLTAITEEAQERGIVFS